MALIDAQKVADYLQFYCVGCNKAISADDLVMAVCGKSNPSLKRDLSDIVAGLRCRGFPVFADGRGYYWATEPDQIAKLCKLLYKRAMTALSQITKLKRICLPDLAGQMRLPVGSEPTLPMIERRDFKPIAMEVQIPEDLHEAMWLFLDSHPNWDIERLYVAALSLWLLQQGSESDATARLYIQTLEDSDVSQGA